MNSMIMHKLNSIADLFLKLGPIIIMWNIHWNIRNTEESKFWGFSDVSKDTFSIEFITKYVYFSTTLYLVWALFYFLIIPSSTQKYGEIQRIKEVGEIKGKLIYFIFHYFLFIGSGLTLGLLSYFCQSFHLLIIIVACCISFWNGGKYYMDYFGKKYEINLSMLEEKDKDK